MLFAHETKNPKGHQRTRATRKAVTMCLLAAILLAAGVVSAVAQCTAPVYPGSSWATATPESQGMSSTAVNAAANLALSKGGSGCVIRGGYMIKEWGSTTTKYDIKSCSKGAVGTTVLGLLMKMGAVGLDDLAQTHYPAIGTERSANVATGWLPQITIKHLATMTAGFDDSRPPYLLWQPGTKGYYSNDTTNMLAELCTLKFGQDLKTVLSNQVMSPLSISSSDWDWRTNAYRPTTINGITSREFASGITITHRALAKIGYLYLRDGEWNGNQILTEDYINIARHTQSWNKPVEAPSPSTSVWNDYGMYWLTNTKRSYPNIPSDMYFAWGLGDSIVAVCPSLDLVVVRMGTGSESSNLGSGTLYDMTRVANFLQMITDGATYPSSQVICGISWAPTGEIMRAAQGSDNWPMTWGDDDNQYTCYGDGWGFEPLLPTKLGLGFAKVQGGPTGFQGVNIRSATGEQIGDGASSKKGSGMLMVDGVLYMFTRNADNSQLAWSSDHGSTWTWASWKFTTSFGYPTFLNFGKNYAGARDEYVYLYSHDSGDAYVAADSMVLARVPKTQITNRNSYQFFSRLDPNGSPIWVTDINQRGPVFTLKGKCFRSGVTYNAGIGRYLMNITVPNVDWWGFGIYDAPEPWGPWTKVYYTDHWDVRPGDASSFPTKWISVDGRTMYLVFSGDDCFAVRKATLTVGIDEEPPSVPTSVLATALSPTAAKITWEASTDNVGVAGYKIYRNSTQVGTSTTTSYNNTGLTPGATYSYTVSAYDSVNESAQSSPAAVVTLPSSHWLITNVVPANYQVTTFDVGTATFIDRAYTVSTMPNQYCGMTGVQTANNDKDNIYLDFHFTLTQEAIVYICLRGVTPNTPVLSDFVDTGDVIYSTDTPNNDYKVWKKTYPAGLVYLGPKPDAGDGRSMYFVLAEPVPITDTQPPSVPTNVQATAMSSSLIEVTWTASTDDTGVEGYTIFRNGSPVGTSPTTSYSDMGLSPNTTYSYTVSAYDAANNNSSQSSPAAVTTTLPVSDTEPPSVPTNVQATALLSNVVVVMWTASTDNVGVIGYKVFRNGVEIGTSIGTNYTDSGLSANTTYSYTVSAYDAEGNDSAQSLPPATAITPGQATETFFEEHFNTNPFSTRWMAFEQNCSTPSSAITWTAGSGSDCAGAGYITINAGGTYCVVNQTPFTATGYDFLRCSFAYYLTGGSMTMQCLKNGSWTTLGSVTATGSWMNADILLATQRSDTVTGVRFYLTTSSDKIRALDCVKIYGVNVAPTVTINQANDQMDPTTSSSINFTTVFSESVTGFTSDDVVLGGTAGATTVNVTGSGAIYNAAVSGMTSSGTVIASIPPGIAINGAGYGNDASVSADNTVTYYEYVPTVVDITAAKDLPDGTLVQLDSKIVTAIYGNSFYIEEVDRNSGIKIASTGVPIGLIVGKSVQVTGHLEKDDSGERYIAADTVSVL